MSRTDKDRPYWVKTNDPTLDRDVDHYHHPRWRAPNDDGVCDLGPTPQARKERWSRSCSYSLPFHEARWHTAPPGWYVNHVFHAPERVRTRDVLREAAKEWNATHATDLEPEERQARHSARGMWW